MNNFSVLLLIDEHNTFAASDFLIGFCNWALISLDLKFILDSSCFVIASILYDLQPVIKLGFVCSIFYIVFYIRSMFGTPCASHTVGCANKPGPIVRPFQWIVLALFLS